MKCKNYKRIINVKIVADNAENERQQNYVIKFWWHILFMFQSNLKFDKYFYRKYNQIAFAEVIKRKEEWMNEIFSCSQEYHITTCVSMNSFWVKLIKIRIMLF